MDMVVDGIDGIFRFNLRVCLKFSWKKFMFIDGNLIIYLGMKSIEVVYVFW